MGPLERKEMRAFIPEDLKGNREAGPFWVLLLLTATFQRDRAASQSCSRARCNLSDTLRLHQPQASEYLKLSPLRPIHSGLNITNAAGA